MSQRMCTTAQHLATQVIITHSQTGTNLVAQPHDSTDTAICVTPPVHVAKILQEN
jgi:hypothetical protein